MSLDRRRSPRERRSSPRLPLVAGVLERADSGRSLAQTRNIGPRGMSLVRVGSDGERLPATPLRLRFQLPGDGAPLEVAAEVVFDREQGRLRATGVRFSDLALADQQRILDFVARARS